MHFLFVVVRSGFFNLDSNLVDSSFNITRRTRAVDHGGVLFTDLYTLCRSKIVKRCAFEAHANFFRDHLAPRENREILQHGFTSIPKSRCFHCADFYNSAHVVYHQRGERLTLNIFSNHQKRTTGFCGSLQNGEHISDVGNLLIIDKDEWVLKISLHRILLINEVRRQVTSIELHALYDVKLVIQALAFFNRNHAFLAHFFHRLGDDVTHRLICVCRNRADLSNLFMIRARLGDSSKFLNGSTNCFVDTPLEIHWVHTGGN